MKPWTRAFVPFLFHVVAAVVDHMGNIGKEVSDILRGDPIPGIIGVLIVAVPGQGIGQFKIADVTVVVLIPGADQVFGKR